MQATFQKDDYSHPFERVAIESPRCRHQPEGTYTRWLRWTTSPNTCIFTRCRTKQPKRCRSAWWIWSCVKTYRNDSTLTRAVSSSQHSAVLQHLCSELGIEKTRTSPYRLQSDGMVQIFNRTLKNMTDIQMPSSPLNFRMVADPLFLRFLAWLICIYPQTDQNSFSGSASVQTQRGT